MSDKTYRCFDGEAWFEVTLPISGSEGVIIPNVTALVFRNEDKCELLLQKRDKPGESIRGKLEIPSGRWRAGEKPQDVLMREVLEETGLRLVRTEVSATQYGKPPTLYVASRPFFVISGFDGGYPVLLVVFECIAEKGEPRSRPGESSDPGWFTLKEITEMITADPDSFTPPALAVLREYLTERNGEKPD